MRLASAAVGGCVVFAGGEVNTTHHDASGIVDVICRTQTEEAGELGVPAASASVGTESSSRGGTAGTTGNAAVALDALDVPVPVPMSVSVAELSARRYELAAATLGAWVTVIGW
jgi:hypothetical protein